VFSNIQSAIFLPVVKESCRLHPETTKSNLPYWASPGTLLWQKDKKKQLVSKIVQKMDII